MSRLVLSIGVLMLLAVVAELLSGCAFLGWMGDNAVVTRKQRGPYWAMIVLHTFFAVMFLAAGIIG